MDEWLAVRSKTLHAASSEWCFLPHPALSNGEREQRSSLWIQIGSRRIDEVRRWPAPPLRKSNVGTCSLSQRERVRVRVRENQPYPIVRQEFVLSTVEPIKFFGRAGSFPVGNEKGRHRQLFRKLVESLQWRWRRFTLS